jgi:Putative DNA-binding domain
VLAPVVDRFETLSREEQHDFRSQLTDYARLYAFLAQVLTFADTDLEMLYVFARHLRRLLPPDRLELPREVQQNIDMESYRIQQTGSGKIALERRPGVLDPVSTKSGYGTGPEELETLSRIIAELNERFGLNLGPEHRVTLGQMMEKLDDDSVLDAAARANARENVRLTFDQKVEDVIQEIVDSNFELYKRITDDWAFGETIKNFLFDHYLRGHRNAEELIKRGESKTLEFKSTLRWNLKEDRKDDQGVTHAALKTIAAFLNTDGGDLLIGVADDGSIVGIERDKLENDDKFMRHLPAALDLCAIADEKIRGAQLAFDFAEDLRWTITFDVADDRHSGADARACRRRIRRRLPPRRGLFNNRVLLLHRPLHNLGRICRRVRILLCCFALEHVHPPFFAGIHYGKA